jgi:hypothetical protein
MLTQRYEEYIRPNIPSAIEDLQRELRDLGCAALDLNALTPAVEAEVRQFCERNEAGARVEGDNALFVVGADGVAVPPALVSSLAFMMVREALERSAKMVRCLEDIADDELALWAQAVTGEDEAELDFRHIVVAPKVSMRLRRLMMAARDVLELDLEDVEVAQSAGGMKEPGDVVFGRDLMRARLHDAQTDALVQDIWRLEAVHAVVEMKEHPALAGHPHRNPIVMLLSLVLERLRLPAAARARLDRILAHPRPS